MSAVGAAMGRVAGQVQEMGAAVRATLEGVGQAIATGHARLGAALEGAVTIAKADLSQAASTLKDAAAQRTQQLAHGAAGVARAVSRPPLAVAGAISNAIDARQAAKETAAAKLHAAGTQRALLRDAIGSQTPSILDQRVTTKDFPHGESLDRLMLIYHAKLTDPSQTGATAPFTQCSAAEMKTFVKMGETIHTALKTWDGTLPLTTVVKGQTIVIPANLDTTRAVAWFMQTKALQDNASPNRDAVFMGSGTTIVKDPGNKLYAFMSSSDNAYGRFSSHFNKSERTERLDDLAPKNSHKGVTGPVLSLSQKLQNGIEDFTDKFPGNGGTMLFERLKTGDDGVGQLFVKFEGVGMPDAILGRVGKHGDVAEEKATAKQAFNRCKHHFQNFFGGKPVIGKILHGIGAVEPKNAAIINRGEQLKKFVGAADVEDYKSFLKSSTLSEADKKSYAPHDTARMLAGLDAMLAGADSFTKAVLDPIKTSLEQKIAARGADLGIVREGGEVHVDFS